MKAKSKAWTTLSRAVVYDNPWIHVEEHQVINPRGGQGIYGVVSFKNRAIGIIPIDAKGYTWLVGQERYTLNEYSWEIPMGGGAMDCTPLEAAKRELQEETGLQAASWEELLKIHTSNSVTDEVGYVFLAKDLQHGPPAFDETELLKIKHLPFEEALAMAMQGAITDSLSLAGLFKAAKVLGIWK
jgi:8-oxo-dGTP pyrophosphatase MutT (NUDIX family)